MSVEKQRVRRGGGGGGEREKEKIAYLRCQSKNNGSEGGGGVCVEETSRKIAQLRLRSKNIRLGLWVEVDYDREGRRIRFCTLKL